MVAFGPAHGTDGYPLTERGESNALRLRGRLEGITHTEVSVSPVIDDVEALYADRSGVRLLKCLCQTEEEKSVAWHSDARGRERQGIPREFTTKSRVVIIANDWKWQTRCPLLQEPLILSSSCDGINGEVVNAVPSAW